MSRPRHILYPDNWYHVMNRGERERESGKKTGHGTNLGFQEKPRQAADNMNGVRGILFSGTNRNSQNFACRTASYTARISS
jgi:hypothetical protein